MSITLCNHKKNKTIFHFSGGKKTEFPKADLKQPLRTTAPTKTHVPLNCPSQ